MNLLHIRLGFSLFFAVIMGMIVMKPVLAVTTTSTVTQHAGPQKGDDPLVGWMVLSGSLRNGPAPYTWLTNSDWGASLPSVVRRLEDVAKDDRYIGVVIHLDEVEIGLSQINELSRAIKSIRAAGQKVMVFAQNYDLLSFTLACSADRILLQHKGTMELMGISVEELYMAGLLEKIGLKADLLQIGRFKGAEEPLTRTGPSQAWSETMDAILDDIYALVIDQIMQGRGFDHDEVEKILAECWSMTDEQYVQRGLIDHLSDRDLTEVMAVEFGNDFQWSELLEETNLRQSIENPFAFFRLLFQEPSVQTHRPTLAVIYASGAITSGEGQVENAFGAETIGSRTLSQVLGEAQENSDIKGVLLRIDSPGGSALASEVIWQAVQELADVKPVFVSIGSMAASGGYYIACAGHRIYASSGSLIGSIGVVGGKFILGQLYDKIGIRVHRRARGPLGDMFNSVEPFTQQQRSVIGAAFRRTYDQFINRVMTGRGDRVTDIESVAQGRLFTGRRAANNGLIDQLGGIDTALAGLVREVKLEPGTYDVINLPGPQSLSEMMEQWFQLRHLHTINPKASLVNAADALLGPRAWREAQRVLSGLVLIREEPILTLMPVGLVIR